LISIVFIKLNVNINWIVKNEMNEFNVLE